MEKFQRIYVVDHDDARRAHLSKIGYDAGIHAEPSQDVEEFGRSTRHDGIVLCADEPGGNLVAKVHEMSTLSKLRLPMLAYSVDPTPSQIVQATLDGAINYLVWPIDAETLRKACSLKSDQLRLTALRSRQAEARSKVAALTRRERNVLGLMTVGHSNKEIGRLLDISHRTVEVHRANLYFKLDLRNSTDAVRIGIFAGLDQEDELSVG